MIGWIIYSIEDYEKNKNFIEMFRERFSPYNVEIETVILEKVNVSQLALPDFAINRSRDYKIAEYLEDRGIRVFNSSKVTQIANDKYRTYKFLEDIVDFMPISKNSQDIPFPKVIKSCMGHGGEEVFLAVDENQEKVATKFLENKEFLYQCCSSNVGKDVRVYVIGSQIVAAVLRTSKESFKSNYSLGGRAELYELNDYEKEMVYKITKKLPMDYAGIDFIFHNNQAVFNEIEDAVGARMLYSVSDIDIVFEYVNYIMNEMC